MSEQKKILGQQYQDLYSNYYSESQDLQRKREISAEQTVDCMREALSGKSFHKLLDVGAGDGNVLMQLSKQKFVDELYAVEISESGVAAIKAKALPQLRDVQLFDGYKIPYPDKFFDLAIAVHVLEHVEHERLFLQELNRVARHLYIEVPLEHGLRIQRSISNGKKFGHINFYTIDALRGLLESSGLKVMGSKVVPSSLKYEQNLSGRATGLLKHVIRKSALAAAPGIAPWFIIYNGYAYCVCA